MNRSDMVYAIYGFMGYAVAEVATVIAEPNSVFCRLQAFPAGNGSNSFENNEKACKQKTIHRLRSKHSEDSRLRH